MVPCLAQKLRLIVLDLNGLLLKRYMINYYHGNPKGFANLVEGFVYKLKTPQRVQGKQHFQYVVRLDDMATFLHCTHRHFKICIWSSLNKEHINIALFECFDEIASLVDMGLKGQNFYRKYPFSSQDIPWIPRSHYNEKPIFLKVVDDLWAQNTH